MMTHDPFQNYQPTGAYPGGATPFGSPYTAFQSPFNPMAQTGQPFANSGFGGNGTYPQQPHGGGIPGQQGLLQQLLALNALAASQQNLPQNPLLQHPLAQGLWQNPLLAAGLQNPLLNPMLAYQGWPQQQQPFNYPPAPQSLIGAGGVGQPFGGQPFGQINPLAQLALRQAAGYGMSPFAGYF
jgi:hypothetical protein